MRIFGRGLGGGTGSTLEVPVPWKTTPKPHPKTNPLARFRIINGVSALSTATHPAAAVIHQARCEVASDQICSPINLSISRGGSSLALNAAGGYKDRAPILTLWEMSGDVTKYPKSIDIEVGLESVAAHLFMDDLSKLVFVADDGRVKSFALARSVEKRIKKRGLPVHTLDSSEFEGPLWGSGRQFFRAGKGLMGVWDMDALSTHGPDGFKLIGEEKEIEDTWRDDDDEIELSSGDLHHRTVTFTDKNLQPWQWHAHPSKAGSMLCASNFRETSSYGCVVLDLETGDTSDIYLGHGGGIQDFSTSESDRNVFLTACSDGFARLYDTRSNLPALTFDVAKSGSFCTAATLCHPDGIPTIFTASSRTESIKVWDIRAKAALYELATGNNSVSCMAWDSTNNSLHAATECEYVDRLGYHHDYRPAKIPRARNDEPDDERIDNDEDQEESDGYESEDEQIAWPKNAFHGESYFGYAFDAGEHRICEY